MKEDLSSLIKYYYYGFLILLIKPFVYIENKWKQYKEWRLKQFCRNKIILENNYDIDTIITLCDE